MVMPAIIAGKITPKNATNFLKPELTKKAFVQVINTKMFIAIWIQPANKFKLVIISVKFAIKKKMIAVPPEIVIHLVLCSFIIKFSYTRVYYIKTV